MLVCYTKYHKIIISSLFDKQNQQISGCCWLLWIFADFDHICNERLILKISAVVNINVSSHLYTPHRSERCSGIQMPYLHTPRTVPPLWPFLLVTCGVSSCTQQVQQQNLPPSLSHSCPPGVLSSVHIFLCGSTIHLHCTEGSSSE